jgi:hypothetical protein
MAILTAAELDDVRHQWQRDADGIPWSRPKVNAALQAVEDVFTGTALQTALSNAIDAAIAPGTMTAAQKRVLVKHWLWSRFARGN